MVLHEHIAICMCPNSSHCVSLLPKSYRNLILLLLTLIVRYGAASRVAKGVPVIVHVLQFHNGVYFILMIGLLEGYFVPLYQYHFNPTTVDEKVSTTGTLATMYIPSWHVL